MSTASEGFAAWACDPKRTVEERFGAELVIEQNLHLWQQKHGLKVEFDHDARRRRQKARSLNPAYDPVISPADAEHVAEVLPGVESISLEPSYDRELRDVAVLRFFPAAKTLSIGNAAIRDWTPLQFVPALTSLSIRDDKARDLRPLAGLTQLTKLDLHLRSPWPDLAGLARLVQLEEFKFSGNLMALLSVPALPAVRVA